MQLPAVCHRPPIIVFAQTSHSTRPAPSWTLYITIIVHLVINRTLATESLPNEIFYVNFEVRLIQGGSRLARSRGNVNISDRFIGTTDLWGWATRPYFRVAPTRLHPQKHGNPEITSPAEHGTRQHGISPTNYISLTEGAVNHGMPNIWNQIPNYESRYVTSVPVTIG